MSSSIMEYYGGSVVAMTGKQCVCIASDLRVGDNMTTVAVDQKKIHKLADRIYMGYGGFRADGITVLEKMEMRKNLYELRENRKIKPKVIARMLSNLLYEHRFGSYFISSLVAGLDPLTFEPYICDMDGIGCISNPRDFVIVGTAEECMLAVCEGYWHKDMEPDELFEATAQVMLAGLNRDANSGWGAVVYTVTKDKVNVKTLRSRLD